MDWLAVWRRRETSGLADSSWSASRIHQGCGAVTVATGIPDALGSRHRIDEVFKGVWEFARYHANSNANVRSPADTGRLRHRLKILDFTRTEEKRH